MHYEVSKKISTSTVHCVQKMISIYREGLLIEACTWIFGNLHHDKWILNISHCDHGATDSLSYHLMKTSCELDEVASRN